MRPLTILALTLLLSTVARADPQDFVGHVLVGVDPIGTRLGYTEHPGDVVQITQHFDVAGRLGRTRAATIWLGGELAVADGATSTTIEPGIFALFTFEQLFHIPLVPMFRVGFSDAQVLGGSNHGTLIANDGELKFGAGLYYFVTPRVGIGFDARVALLLGAQPHDVRLSDVGGFTDLEAGLRFAL